MYRFRELYLKKDVKNKFQLRFSFFAQGHTVRKWKS